MYVYQADTYCDDCGGEIARKLAFPADADPENESTWDSGDYPKGPYPEDQQETDHPDHCAGCEVLLDCALTENGAAYVLEQLHAHLSGGKGRPEILAEWLERYRDEVRQAWTGDDTDAVLDALPKLLRG